MAALPSGGTGICSLRGSARESLESLIEVREVRADSVLYSEGDVAEGVFIVYHGGAKLTHASRNAHEFSLRCESTVLGLDAVLDSARHRATAHVLVDSTLGFVRADRFRSFVDEYPEAAWLIEVIRERKHVYDKDIVLETRQSA